MPALRAAALSSPAGPAQHRNRAASFRRHNVSMWRRFDATVTQSRDHPARDASRDARLARMALTATLQPLVGIDPALAEPTYEVILRPIASEADLERLQRWAELEQRYPPPPRSRPTTRRVWLRAARLRSAAHQPGPRGHARPTPRQHRPRPHAAQRRRTSPSGARPAPRLPRGRPQELPAQLSAGPDDRQEAPLGTHLRTQSERTELAGPVLSVERPRDAVQLRNSVARGCDNPPTAAAAH